MSVLSRDATRHGESSDLTPIDDVRSTADYRLRVAKNLGREFLAGHLGLMHGVITELPKPKP